MVLLRPVEMDDLDDIFELAMISQYGLTTLPKDKDLLRDRIEFAVQTFVVDPQKPRGELYFFVLEDLDKKKVIGTCAIVSKVGGFEPFYTYEIRYETARSEKLNITKERGMLHLVEDYNGPTEIGSLFLHPDYRKGGYGKLLSVSRFIYMSENPNWFEPVIIAEMRGVVHSDGHSPFWEAIGRHFINLEFNQADYLSIVDKSFIADLIPKVPIYIDLLPKEAKEVINKVHPNTEPAIAILKKEGFQLTGMIDIFEAGPMVQCNLNDIKSVKEKHRCQVNSFVHRIDEGNYAIIMNPKRDCKASLGYISSLDEGIAIEKTMADIIEIELGDEVSYILFTKKEKA